MPEFTNAGGSLGRSIYDAPERSGSEIEAERIERIMAQVSRRDLERALIVMLSAARTAEGEQGRLHDTLRPVVSKALQDCIDNIGSALVEEGIDQVAEIIGADALDILEGDA
jgi:hypothetical protein